MDIHYLMDVPGVYFLFLEGDDTKCKIGRSGNCQKRLSSHKTCAKDSDMQVMQEKMDQM